MKVSDEAIRTSMVIDDSAELRPRYKWKPGWPLVMVGMAGWVGVWYWGIIQWAGR